jgi:transposase
LPNRGQRLHTVRRWLSQSSSEVRKTAGTALRGSAGGRPPAFDTERYKDRTSVERAFNKLKAFRAVATRYDKLDIIYQGTIDVASIKISLRDPVP